MKSCNSRPLRILHVFWRLERGGAELRTIELMRAIDRSRYKLEFCSFSGQSGGLDEEVLALGGKVHYCRRAPSFPVRFVRLLRLQRYDIVHSHIDTNSGIILLLAWFAGVPGRIAHFRNSQAVLEAQWPRRLLEFVLKILIKASATHVLGVSWSALTGRWGHHWSKDRRFSVVYSGIDLTRFREETDREGVFHEFGVPATSHLFIHVGRFYPQKNHSKLLMVFADILRSDPSAYLFLVGKGTLQSEVERNIVALNLGDRVILAGLRSDVPRLLKAADVMIFPSLWEGMPGAVLEAIACGVPVLAARLPAILEIQQYFRGAYTLEQSESNNVWAAKALQLVRTSHPANPPAVFEKSPFTLKESSRKFCAIWDDAARRYESDSRSRRRYEHMI